MCPCRSPTGVDATGIFSPNSSDFHAWLCGGRKAGSTNHCSCRHEPSRAHGPLIFIHRPAPTGPTHSHPLVGSGPIQPSCLTVIQIKSSKKILDLEFVEMAEVTVEDYRHPGTHRPQRGYPSLTYHSGWSHSLMAATIAGRFPEKASELFAYQVTIIRAERTTCVRGWPLGCI